MNLAFSVFTRCLTSKICLAAVLPPAARFAVCLCLFFAMNITSSHAQQNNWLLTRPAGSTGDLNAVFFADSKRGWVGGDAGALLRTTDEGATWISQVLSVNASVTDIHFQTKEDGCLVAGSAVLCTTDGGGSWMETAQLSPKNFDGLTPDLLSITFANKRRGVIVGSLARGDAVLDSLVLLSEDGGATWARIVVPTKNELIDVDFTNNEQALIVGAGGTILFTQDGGRTWASQNSGTQATLYGVEFRGGRLGWAVGERGTILRTTSGGDAWLPLRPSVRSTLLGVRFTSDEKGFAIGRGGAILRSIDGGDTWLRQESRTRENLYALYPSKEQWWVVGGKGVLLRQER